MKQFNLFPVTRGIVAIIHGQHILYTYRQRSNTYTFILILKLLINICFNMLFTWHNYHIIILFFLCQHKRDDFVVADR